MFSNQFCFHKWCLLFFFSFVVLAFRNFSSLRTHFGPFTEVLRRICWFVTRKNANHGLASGTDGLLAAV